MKFSLTIVITAALTLTLFSCSKEKVPAPSPVTTGIKPVTVIKFDGSGLDSTGTIAINGSWGMPAYTTDHKGNPNAAMEFDGSDKIEYYDLPLKGQAVSMVTWVKFPGAGLGTEYFVTANRPDLGGVTFSQSNQQLGSSVSVTGTNSVFSPALDLNWHHLAMTYDGKDIKVYVDGELSGTQNHPGSIGDGKRALVIGGTDSYFWKGTIDDLRIYDVVLTNEQISKLMAQ